jgi:hypothetical protein
MQSDVVFSAIPLRVDHSSWNSNRESAVDWRIVIVYQITIQPPDYSVWDIYFMIAWAPSLVKFTKFIDVWHPSYFGTVKLFL